MVVLRWTGGAPDVVFHLEGRDVTNVTWGQSRRSVICEVPSTDGVIEIPNAVLAHMSLRAYTVAVRRLDVGKWPLTVRLGGEVLARAGEFHYVADLRIH